MKNQMPGAQCMQRFLHKEFLVVNLVAKARDKAPAADGFPFRSETASWVAARLPVHAAFPFPPGLLPGIGATRFDEHEPAHPLRFDLHAHPGLQVVLLQGAA